MPRVLDLTTPLSFCAFPPSETGRARSIGKRDALGAVVVRDAQTYYVRIRTTARDAWITALALLRPWMPWILLKQGMTRRGPWEMRRRRAGLLILLLSMFLIPAGECLGRPLCDSMPKKACCMRTKHCGMPTQVPSKRRETCPRSHATAVYLSGRAEVPAVARASAAELDVDSHPETTAQNALGGFQYRPVAAALADHSPPDKLSLHSTFLI